MKLVDEVKELKDPIKELRTNIVEKETCLDHFQKKNDDLSTSLSKAKGQAIRGFKMSSEFTELLDKSYAAGFENFRQDAIKAFPGGGL